MRGLAILWALVLLILSACSPAVSESGVAEAGQSLTDEEEIKLTTESWRIGEDWEYGQQAISGDVMVGIETGLQDGRRTYTHISLYNLRTREKTRVLELPADRILHAAPAICGSRVVWASVDREEAETEGRAPLPNWEVFLLDLDTGEVRQLTTDEHAQMHPRIDGDTVVWLDARHEEGYHNPRRYDVYTYDLSTGQETRLTSTTSVEGRDLVIDGDLVVWTDNRHADPEITLHAGNEPDYNNEIYVYDLAAGQKRRVTTYPGNDYYPAIDGSRIVWLRQYTYREADLFYCDLGSSQETRVSRSRYAAYRPDVSGDWIVWTDARASKGNTNNDVIEIDASTSERREPAADIYLYDLEAQQEVKLTSPLNVGFSLWMNPCICNDFVVYELNRQVGPVVYAMRLVEK